MEKVENKVSEENTKAKSNKVKIIVISIVSILVLVTAGIVATVLINRHNKSLKEEEIIEILDKAGKSQNLDRNSVKSGPEIDFNFNQYNKMLAFSCTYSKDGKSVEIGGIILENKNDKMYQYIECDANVSSLIFSFNTQNKVKELKELMKIIGTYFEQNGIDNFSKASDDKARFYKVFSKKIGDKLGVKRCREIVDIAFKKLMEGKPAETLYERGCVFPTHLCIKVTEKKYAWRRFFQEQYVQNLYLYDRSIYNTMVSAYGEPYVNETKYGIYLLTTNTNDALIGKYDSKEEAKEKLKLEEASDEPQQESNQEDNQPNSENNNNTELNSKNININENNNESSVVENSTETDNSINNGQENNSSESTNQDVNTANQNNANEVKKITVPDVTGMSIKEAKEKIKSLGLECKTKAITSFNNESKVFYQNVNGGTSVMPSKVIELKWYRKVIQVTAQITVKSGSEKYNNKKIKLVVNDKELGEDTFNNNYGVANFVQDSNVTIKVYIDNTLVKTQSFNVDEIAKKKEIGDNDIPMEINI